MKKRYSKYCDKHPSSQHNSMGERDRFSIQYKIINSRLWNNGIFNSFIPAMRNKKLAIFGFLSFIVLVLLAIVINFRKHFTPERDNRKMNLFPPNPEVPLPPSSSVLHLFKNAAINSDSEECSLIGRSVLQRNGNVVDATLSVMFCLGLTSMQSMGLGGGFIMNLFIHKDAKAYTINARERAPIMATNESYFAFRLQNNEETKSSKMFTGPFSIGTPGEVLGYWELHKRFSVIKWKDLIEPTIRLCESGFILSKHMADSFRMHKSFKNIPHYREMFLNAKTGQPMKPGSIVKPPHSLCSTYRLLASNGGNDFYTGELADLIISDLIDIGSVISKSDFEAYRVQITESIPIKFAKDILYVTPPGGGTIVAYALNILRQYNMTVESADKAIIYHRIIEVLKFAFAERSHLSDPLFEDMRPLIMNLTSFETADRIRQLIDDEQTFTYQHYNPSFSIDTNHGTSHISIIAPNGDAVSVTSSINYYFGSGLAGRRSGIIFNSGMDDFSYPKQTNYFDLPPSPHNYLQPLKQALTSMTPIIVTDNFDRVKIVIGAAGGVKIISAVLLALVQLMWLGNDVKQAVDLPRIHHQLLPMILEYEYGNEQTLIDELQKRGHVTKRYRNRGSIINALCRNETGIYGVADYRKQGEGADDRLVIYA